MKIPTDPSCFLAGWRCHPEGPLGLAMASPPWPATGSGKKAAELSLAGLELFNLLLYRMRYTHFVIHISLQMSFYGSAKSHKRALAFPSIVLPFWTQLHFSKKHSATKICNVQTKVSVRSSFATCKLFIIGSLRCTLFFQPMTHYHFSDFGLGTVLCSPLEDYSKFLFLT